jgi:predicted  nucleic acid-binding Zn-ribbon protein
MRTSCSSVLALQNASPVGSILFFEEGRPMRTVEEDIQSLIQIVKKDMEIKERKKYIESVPLRIRAIDTELAKMEDALGETKAVFDHLEKERARLELDIKSQNQKIRDKRAEEPRVKDNKMYRALMAEIEFLAKQVKQEEERMLAVLEELEVRKKELKTLADKSSGEKSRLLDEKTRLIAELRAAEDSLKILEDEKVRILPHLTEEVRRLYTRILKVKGDSGVANLVGDICQGCYSRVPPQKAHEIRRNSQLITCEVCGRILVYFSTN